VPLLNKADTETDIERAREIARQMLAASVDSVVVSSMIQDPPVRETWSSTAGIILAAGMSTRFGTTKQALPWEDTTLAAHSVRTALDAGLDPVIAVLGCDAAKVEKALSGLPARIVFNPDYAAGQSTSIRKALDALPCRTGAALFMLADQPLIDADLLKEIIQAHRRACLYLKDDAGIRFCSTKRFSASWAICVATREGGYCWRNIGTRSSQSRRAGPWCWMSTRRMITKNKKKKPGAGSRDRNPGPALSWLLFRNST
jgi:molybdopterin-guanine dinucleotide biosynthesis protein A